jgi:hypothetical protein
LARVLVLELKAWLTMLQILNDDADVQQLKQRRQNLMYQVAVLQLQRVSAAATPPAQAP